MCSLKKWESEKTNKQTNLCFTFWSFFTFFSTLILRLFVNVLPSVGISLMFCLTFLLYLGPLVLMISTLKFRWRCLVTFAPCITGPRASPLLESSSVRDGCFVRSFFPLALSHIFVSPLAVLCPSLALEERTVLLSRGLLFVHLRRPFSSWSSAPLSACFSAPLSRMFFSTLRFPSL